MFNELGRNEAITCKYVLVVIRNVRKIGATKAINFYYQDQKLMAANSR